MSLASQVTLLAQAIAGQLNIRPKFVQSSSSAVGTSATQITGPIFYGTSLVNVHLVASNYDKSYLLWVLRDPYNGNLGQVVQLAVNNHNNSTSIGEPTWSVSNANLYAALPNSPGNVSAYVRMTQIGY